MTFMTDVLSFADRTSGPAALQAGWAFFASLAPAHDVAIGRVLHTATMLVRQDGYELAMFHACHAETRAEVLANIAERLPRRFLSLVEVREGIDPDDAIVVRLVPEPMRLRLAEIGDCSPTARPLAFGRCLHVAEHVAV